MFMLNPKLLSEVFPINKVEVFFDAENHSNFLGFQWEMVSQGKVPIGLDTSDTDFNEIGKTGGEKEVTLGIEHIPPHDHNDGKINEAITANDGGRSAVIVHKSESGTIPTTKTGGGQPHNNMPPYMVMAFWKRVA